MRESCDVATQEQTAHFADRPAEPSRIRGEGVAQVTPTLDLRSAAALLHQHEHTVEAWARKRKIPAHRVGRRWLFVSEELIDWIREQPGGLECRSTGAAASGGACSPQKATQRLRSLLAPATVKRRRNGTTAAPPNSGASESSGI